jgi:Ca-activated chloride channel family protein
LVNPKIGTKMETVKREGIDIVFAVDVSKSMLAEDVAPNRLDKKQANCFANHQSIRKRSNRIVAYAGNAFQYCQLQPIIVAKMFLCMNTDMVSVGTSLNEAIKLSSTYYDDKKPSKLLIMISDGKIIARAKKLQKQ